LIYHLLVERLEAAYSTSAYKYSTKFLLLCRSYINANCIAVFVLGQLYFQAASLGNQCYSIFSARNWFVLIYAFNDIFINTTCLILFVKPLITIIRAIDPEAVDTAHNHVMIRLAVKSTHATFGIMLSTLIGVTAAAVGLPQVMIFEDCLRCLCVLFFNNTFDKIYEVTCKCCICWIEYLYLKYEFQSVTVSMS